MGSRSIDSDGECGAVHRDDVFRSVDGEAYVEAPSEALRVQRNGATKAPSIVAGGATSAPCSDRTRTVAPAARRRRRGASAAPARRDPARRRRRSRHPARRARRRTSRRPCRRDLDHQRGRRVLEGARRREVGPSARYAGLPPTMRAVHLDHACMTGPIEGAKRPPHSAHVGATPVSASCSSSSPCRPL